MPPRVVSETLIMRRFATTLTHFTSPDAKKKMRLEAIAKSSPPPTERIENRCFPCTSPSPSTSTVVIPRLEHLWFSHIKI